MELVLKGANFVPDPCACIQAQSLPPAQEHTAAMCAVRCASFRPAKPPPRTHLQHIELLSQSGSLRFTARRPRIPQVVEHWVGAEAGFCQGKARARNRKYSGSPLTPACVCAQPYCRRALLQSGHRPRALRSQPRSGPPGPCIRALLTASYAPRPPPHTHKHTQTVTAHPQTCICTAVRSAHIHPDTYRLTLIE
jgi:hypothetical protein